MIKIFEKTEGETSSKRVAGFVMMISGSSLLLLIGIVAVFNKEEMPNAETALTAGQSLIITGSSLLGATVFEGITGLFRGGRNG